VTTIEHLRHTRPQRIALSAHTLNLYGLGIAGGKVIRLAMATRSKSRGRTIAGTVKRGIVRLGRREREWRSDGGLLR
jgi:hypothetical protein